MGVCNCSMFCCTLLYVHSSIEIILVGERELFALLYLSSWCLVMVERLFLAVPQSCLQFVIVVFPDHTHLLFLFQTAFFLSWQIFPVFFSSCSTMLAFDRRINPFSLVSVNCLNVFFFSLRFFFFNTSITFASVDSEILFCNSFIAFVNFFSCLFVSFFLIVAYFIVSFLIVPLINFHFGFGFASLFISAISAMLFLTVSR